MEEKKMAEKIRVMTVSYTHLDVYKRQQKDKLAEALKPMLA